MTTAFILLNKFVTTMSFLLFKKSYVSMGVSVLVQVYPFQVRSITFALFFCSLCIRIFCLPVQEYFAFYSFGCIVSPNYWKEPSFRVSSR